jgi:hypothetical protein
VNWDLKIPEPTDKLAQKWQSENRGHACRQVKTIRERCAHLGLPKAGEKHYLLSVPFAIDSLWPRIHPPGWHRRFSLHFSWPHRGYHRQCFRNCCKHTFTMAVAEIIAKILPHTIVIVRIGRVGLILLVSFLTPLVTSTTTRPRILLRGLFRWTHLSMNHQHRMTEMNCVFWSHSRESACKSDFSLTV